MVRTKKVMYKCENVENEKYVDTSRRVVKKAVRLDE